MNEPERKCYKCWFEICYIDWDRSDTRCADCPPDEWLFLWAARRRRCLTSVLDVWLTVYRHLLCSLLTGAFSCCGGGGGCGTCTVHVSNIFVCATLKRKGGELTGCRTGREVGLGGRSGWAVDRSRFCCVWNVTHVTKAEWEKLVQTMRPSMRRKTCGSKINTHRCMYVCTYCMLYGTQILIRFVCTYIHTWTEYVWFHLPETVKMLQYCVCVGLNVQSGR